MAEPQMQHYEEEPTPQPMAHVEQPHAGVGIRFVAILVDSVVLGAVGYLVALLFGQTTATGFNLTGGPALLSFAIFIAYFIAFEKYGATPGKMVSGLRVVNENGTNISWGESAIRNLLRIVDGLFFYLVGAILVWTSPQKQRLGDRLAHTYVVHKKPSPSSGYSEPPMG